MERRQDGREWNQLRPFTIERAVNAYAEGSSLVTVGGTRVLCTASVEEKVPSFRLPGQGWLTAEYAMLPRATHSRGRRERDGASGRTTEIQRLIGRSLRAMVDLEALGPRMITVDCDVLQADGGTRCASITGACVAVVDALRAIQAQGKLDLLPLRAPVAAVSVGMVNGRPLLDLCYEEDSSAEVDFNVVMTAQGEFVELQGTAEGQPFGRETLDRLLELAQLGLARLFDAQRISLGMPPGAAWWAAPGDQAGLHSF